MGNAGSNHPKEWNRDLPLKLAETGPSSPSREGEAFTFDKKIDDDDPRGRDEDNGIEDGAPYYTKAAPESDVEFSVTQPRTNILIEEPKITDDLKVLPTVFKWEGGGKQVSDLVCHRCRQRSQILLDSH